MNDEVEELEVITIVKKIKYKGIVWVPENVKKKEETRLEPNRTENGQWRGNLEDEEPITKYGTISIYPTIKDYIWDELPTDFKHMDVISLFKKFYEKKLGRKLKGSSYSTYASRYIRFYKDQDPPIMSWDERKFSKDVDKYRIVEGEPEKEITDGDQARKTLLKKSKDEHEDEHAHVDEHEDEFEQSSASNETKRLLMEEKKEIEETTEPEPVTTKTSNPFFEGSAEHHLYQIAVESWIGFRKGTPKIMVMKRMTGFPKEQIDKAIDMLVKKKKAKILPNNFIAFSV